MIIANLLVEKGLGHYRYEERLTAPDGSVRYPDFTIEDDDTGITVYWEHLGLLHDPAYRERWEKKLAWYAAQNILPFDKAQPSARVLVTTRDDTQGGIDSGHLAAVIEEVFGR